ncbi:MAG: hypothetical protein P8Y97_15110 [Candidatus Lokiarchaeota archaeon]
MEFPSSTGLGDLWNRAGGYPSILGGITTLVIFVIVVWFESTRVEIPLQYSGTRGFKSKYPMKLLYVSNIPVILVNALYANFLFFGQMIAGPNSALRSNPALVPWINLIGIFQTSSQGGSSYLQPVWGLMLFLTPPRSVMHLFQNLPYAIVYLIIFIALCIILGRTWVEVSGLAPRDIAGQIIDSGMHIPGFRSSEKIIERILKKYIPTLVILNGFIIGILAFFADTLGALTTGTGLLISIGITHQYAETISKEFAASQYPGLRGLLGID